MAPTAGGVRKRWGGSSRFFRFYYHSQGMNSKKGVSRGMKRIPQNTGISEPAEDLRPPSFSSNKAIPFALPRLDESKLIIEEVAMGPGFGPKTQPGSKVSVKCSYKTEHGDHIETKNHNFVLGHSKVLEGLHNGIYGM